MAFFVKNLQRQSDSPGDTPHSISTVLVSHLSHVMCHFFLVVTFGSGAGDIGRTASFSIMSCLLVVLPKLRSHQASDFFARLSLTWLLCFDVWQMLQYMHLQMVSIHEYMGVSKNRGTPKSSI